MVTKLEMEMHVNFAEVPQNFISTSEYLFF